MADAAEYITRESIDYIVDHLFLPPLLPQENDYSKPKVQALCDIVLQALQNFALQADNQHASAIQAASELLQSFTDVHTIRTDFVSVQPERLSQKLRKLCSKGGSLLLQISAQNAAVLANRVDDSIQFELWELTPTNNSIVDNKGRLLRCFPGQAMSVPVISLQQDDVIESLAQSIGKMSQQDTTLCQPTSKKAGKKNIESRHSPNPIVVTDYLSALLLSLGTPAVVSVVKKHMREEVLWSECLIPWTRSPTWLVFRVALNLTMSRMETRAASSPGGICAPLYKQFITYLMARVLHISRKHALESDMLSIMTSKLSRRLHKLGATTADWLHAYANAAIVATNSTLDGRWKAICDGDPRNPKYSSLNTLDFHKDVFATIPELDRFLDSLSQLRTEQPAVTFVPKLVLQQFAAADLPSVNTSPDGYGVFDLAAIEIWIENFLNPWLERHIASQTTCTSLVRLLQSYHKAASARYQHNPEGISLMVLTCMELWVACNKSAQRICPLLSEFHDASLQPSLVRGLLQSLILPHKSQLERLNAIEEYLQICSSNSKSHRSSVFTHFGGANSFAVAYYNTSYEQQQLLSHIERQAGHERKQKEEELARLQSVYNNLVAQANAMSCEWHSYINNRGRRVHAHDWGCRKCAIETQYNNLEIVVHEWPLPKAPNEAKNAVFELSAPQWFTHWRDTTGYTLRSVLSLAYKTEEKPREIYRLASYPDLIKHDSVAKGQRIAPVSAVKSFLRSHYRTKKIGSVTHSSDVIVDHAPRYKYFDEIDQTITSNLAITDDLSRNCMLKLPAVDSALQSFLRRPSSMPNGPSPNTVIASQHSCPQHMHITEFKELCSLPLGFRLQWQNILRQLQAPSVDFNQLSTFVFIAQCVTQSGPACSGNVLRASHSILEDSNFSIELIKGVRVAATRLSESWQSTEAFRSFVLITTRLLQLTSDANTITHCSEFLVFAGETMLSWAKSLKKIARESQTAEQRGAFRRRAAKCALICSLTFDVDDDQLVQLLRYPQELTLFLQCSLIVHEGNESPGGDQVLANLLWQWQRLSYRALHTIASHVTSDSQALDRAIQSSWSGHIDQRCWTSVSARNPEWLVGERPDSSSPVVHFNLLTGELFVNGLPLNRLPSEYEGHETYKILFGTSIIEVMPGSVPGFPFSTNVPFAKHDVQFALSPASSHLYIRASTVGNIFHFVPAGLLRDCFPDAFVDDYVHFYDEKTRSISFRPRRNPWKAAHQPWTLARVATGQPWQLCKDSTTVVSLGTPTSEAIAAILSTLEVERRIHCLLSADHNRLELELPGLESRFYLEAGDTVVSCKDFQGMVIDENQCIGTLIGLANKLVLRGSASDSDRLLLVPNGSAYATKTSGHVEVRITKPFSTYLHVFHVDTLLGRLRVDSGLLQSMLFLSHLHALTAFCIPDPLTSRTGTEEALGILRSAALRSFNGLPKDAIDLLKDIASLTPMREFYPQHLREMQTVHWKKCTGFLAQHDGFLEAVVALLDQAEANKFFHEDHAEIDQSQLFPSSHRFLLARNKIRTAQYRVAAYGAEDHTLTYDSSYAARDVARKSATALATYAVANTVRAGGTRPHAPVNQSMADHLWNFLSKKHVANSSSELAELSYDAQWFLSWKTTTHGYLAENWLELHRMLSAPETKRSSFGLATWLASLACAEDSDATIVHALATFYTASYQMSRVQLPTSAAKFQLAQGRALQGWQILDIIEKYRRIFDPYSDIVESRKNDETLVEYHERGHESWRARGDAAKHSFWAHLSSQWPCSAPREPLFGAVRNSIDAYFVVGSPDLLSEVQTLFGMWHENLLFYKYLEDISAIINRNQLTIERPGQPEMTTLRVPVPVGSGAVSVPDLFRQPPPSITAASPTSFAGMLIDSVDSDTGNVRSSRRCLRDLIHSMQSRAISQYEKKYATSLEASLVALESENFSQKTLPGDQAQLSATLQAHLTTCQTSVKAIYEAIVRAITGSASDVFQRPRLSPMLLLQQLNRTQWASLSADWKKLLITYGVALTTLQRARRLCRARGAALIKELQNDGHANWEPADHPEWLLLEVEGAILIRNVQVDIARQMETPDDNGNSVMQLNMGEGKSTVIAPMLVISLAIGGKLMRVIVAKPQSKQMLHMLVSKLGGLIDRQVFHLPFSRAIKIGPTELAAIDSMLSRCRKEGGVLLVQPEHILSFQLMGIEKKIIKNPITADKLLELHELMRRYSRDVVDESDENFSPKFELVYSLGEQQPIDHSPLRWTCIQEVLDVVRKCLPQLQEEFPHGVDVREGPQGCFPRMRLTEPKATERLLDILADRICESGLKGFSITLASKTLCAAVRRYIRNPRLSSNVIELVEQPPPAGFWTENTKKTLLLLRGLIANGILAFAFGQKRWRVDYGLDVGRNPPTRLAVPYRAKDHPSARSEFSHPDVVIVLTSLSYYYQGLTNEQLDHALSHLDRSDQVTDEYATWVKDADSLSDALKQFSGVNLEDQELCNDKLFPCFKHSKAAVDYFLAHVVFTKEMKEFPHRLSASGWDIGEQKTHPTTGFSGTNDAQIVLPLSVKQTALPAQAHTNALVLQYLVQPETAVEIIPSLQSANTSTPLCSPPSTAPSPDQLLDMVVAMDPPVRVILDVGAQIIELDNLEVAWRWLQLLPAGDGDGKRTEAAVFVDRHDNVCVVDRKGRVEPLQSSPYLTQLNLCVVFLDDAHTRGIDLKLPEDYRAAVTLGANLVKDRLVQACMRMRELGKGQSVVFCVPVEIQRKINRLAGHDNLGHAIQPADVLAWAISETWQDARRNTALWAMQGERHEMHSQQWARARGGGQGFDFTENLARELLEEEAQSVETRYRPRAAAAGAGAAVVPAGAAALGETRRLIRERCVELDVSGESSAALQEEQERELAPEVEEQRQLERPAKAEPLAHSVHRDVIAFICAGNLSVNSDAFIPAYQSLRDSSAASYLTMLEHRVSQVYCTRDFQATIVPPWGVRYVSDFYQRPVQWVLTSSAGGSFRHMVVISPYEAQELMETIKTSQHVALHLYAPLTNPGFRSLDKLDLYTVPVRPSTAAAAAVPAQVILELDLFAGQLYFEKFIQFQALCEYLRAEPTAGSAVESSVSDDGGDDDDTPRVLDENLVELLKIVNMKIRRNCETIDKTHTGKALDSRLLTEEDFKV